MQTRTVTINGSQYTLKACTMAAVYYEQVKGEAFKIGTLTDNLLYFWCMLLAGNRDKPILGFSEFVDALDADPDILKAFEELVRDLQENRPQPLNPEPEYADDKKKD